MANENTTGWNDPDDWMEVCNGKGKTLYYVEPDGTQHKPLGRTLAEIKQTTAIEARQRANGCNQDNEPDDWGKPCCDFCICADEAAGCKSMKDECREEGLL